MIFCNGLVFVNGKFDKMDVVVRDGKIVELGKNLLEQMHGETEIIDCKDKMIWPGLFDIHTHGCLGYDFSKANVDEIGVMCKFYARNGVTSVLATTMTNEERQYARAMKNIGKAMRQQETRDEPQQAQIQGINMEGPFLGKEKKGAHNEQFLRGISQQLIDEYQALSGNAIRLVDLDAQLPNALSFIRENKDQFTLSLAHTNCDYETAVAAVKEGVTHVTHLFNAMRPLLHREPGLVGAAFDMGLYAEIICDGVHVHPAVIRLMFAAMQERMVLISDSINPTGLEDGEYMAGGLLVCVKNHRAYLQDGTLAGSTITLFDAVKKAVEFGVPLEVAVRSASYLPAKAVRMEEQVGSIACGRGADLLIVDKDLNLCKVIIKGKFVE